MQSASKTSLETSLKPALEAGATALGLALTADQQQALLQYLDLLNRWNSTYNLTAVRDPQQQLTLHVLDCLAVLPWFLARVAGGQQRVLDVGSGAGLPGLVLALLLPDTQVHVIDKVAKKTAFVTQCKGALGLVNLTVHTARVEQLQQPAFDVITSRAFASLADFVNCTQSLLAQNGVWAAMKGALPEDEIVALPGFVQVQEALPLQVPGLDAQRHLVVLRHAAKNGGNTHIGGYE